MIFVIVLLQNIALLCGMKYSNYIINKPLHPEEFGIIAIPSAIVGVVLLGSLLPFAYVMDGGRVARLRYLQYQKRVWQERHLKCVVVSLGHSVEEWKYLITA